MSESQSTQAAPLIRNLVVLVAVTAAVIAAFIGSGALGGTTVNEAAGGWLSEDATPLAPGGGAFRIWSVIYAGLVGYAVWLLSPTARRSPRQLRIGPWAAASALLNAAWLFSVQLGFLGLSTLVILILLAVLVRILLLMMRSPAVNRVDTVLTDGTFGLYLGWVSVATAANIAAWLGALGAEGFQAWEIAAAAVIVAVAGIGALLGWATGGRIAPALSISWGVAWIAVGRTTGTFTSTVLITTAAVSAAVVLAVTIAARVRRNTQHHV